MNSKFARISGDAEPRESEKTSDIVYIIFFVESHPARKARSGRINRESMNGDKTPTKRIKRRSLVDDSEYFSDESFDSKTALEDTREVLTASENRAVCMLRGVVIVVIVLTGTLFSVLCFISLRHSEESLFENQYDYNARKLLAAFNDRVRIRIGSAESLAESITSYTVDKGIAWPFVALPDFVVRASAIQTLTSSVAISFIPIVTSAKRHAWEQYTAANSQWIEDGIAFEQEMNGNSIASRRELQLDMGLNFSKSGLNFSNGASENIFRLQELDMKASSGEVPIVEDEAGPYLPIWQTSPVIPIFVNFNLNSTEPIADALRASLGSEQTVLSRVVNSQDTNSILQVVNEWNQSALVVLNFPVFDGFEKNSSVVGLLTLINDWSTYFSDVLPSKVRGMLVVLDNDCDQSYTYRVDGSDAAYVGAGDLHDNKYSFLEQRERIAINRNGVQLNPLYCPYTVKIYPSNDTRAQYYTKHPESYAAIVGGIFLLMLILFVSYDRAVGWRQNSVSRTAVENKAIVASLFPDSVHQRLFKKKDPAAPTKSAPSEPLSTFGGLAMPESASLLMQKFLNGAENDGAVPDRIIADMFPETTVFFADIVGFTAWSSQREPTQVFILLQTLYASFDRVAKKLGVFKSKCLFDVR